MVSFEDSLCTLGWSTIICFLISSVTDSLDVRHMNELFSIHHHISLAGEAWKFLHQVSLLEMSRFHKHRSYIQHDRNHKIRVW